MRPPSSRWAFGLGRHSGAPRGRAARGIRALPRHQRGRPHGWLDLDDGSENIIVLEILRDNPDYTKNKKINFQKKDRLEKLDELRVKRDSFKARLKTIEINLEKHKL